MRTRFSFTVLAWLAKVITFFFSPAKQESFAVVGFGVLREQVLQEESGFPFSGVARNGGCGHPALIVSAPFFLLFFPRKKKKAKKKVLLLQFALASVSGNKRGSRLTPNLQLSGMRRC
jgi:hypothetical protein